MKSDRAAVAFALTAAFFVSLSGIGASRTAPLVYAVNLYGYSVLAFDQAANGNVLPSVNISGSNTKIFEPEGMALAPNGTVAVSDSENTLTLYAPGANGNVAPIGAITCGPGGTPGVPEQIAFDNRNNLYVKYFMGHLSPSDAIEVYTPSQQNGCVTGTQVLFGRHTRVTAFGALAVAGDTIYAAGNDGIEEFHTSDNGNVHPFRTISGGKTHLKLANGIAVDKRGYIYVANVNNVLVFAPSARGNAAPVAEIAGSRTMIPQSGYGALSIAVSADRTIFVGVQSGNVPSLLTFAAGSNGNVAPVRVISGSNTLLAWPAELAVSN